MNIKFKMPKFGRNLTGGGMLKELLLTILGTTISIVLTFGTAYILERREANHAQRQTAMMVIHDIDASIIILEKMAENLEKMKQAIQYIVDHFDQIDSLPGDTLDTAMSMLASIYSDEIYFDDSKEKIFNSSQDTWKNLDDVAFVDNMEEFYRSRSDLQHMLFNSPLWKYPISQDEYYEILVHLFANGQSSLNNYSVVLKQKLRDPKIKFYIDYSSSKIRVLRQYAQYWKDLSDRNKFIMNISDEELAEYIKKSQRSGRTVSESDIIGQWERQLPGKDVLYYDFMRSDTFNMKSVNYYANPFYSGDIIVTYRIGGKWYIKSDSVCMEYSPEPLKVEVDSSGISYRAEMRDSVRSFYNNYFQESKLTEKVRKSLESKKDTLGMSINKTNDKIEMTQGHSNNSENESVIRFYIKRVKNLEW